MSNQPKPIDFRDTQAQFANYIRDPANNPAPADIETRRMTIYQELFYNNIQGFIANGFPVIRKLMDDDSWHAMIRDFMIKHKSKTPLFHEIAREFLSYLENERDTNNDPPFFYELAHYEWVELALSVSTEEIPAEPANPGDIMAAKLDTSPLARLLQYQYPVHQISPEFQPGSPAKSAVHLLVYRAVDDSIVFLEFNPVSARLFGLISEGLTGQKAAEQIVTELQHPNAEVVIKGAKNLLQDWFNRRIIFQA